MATTKTITLKGSVDIVREFFDYSINSILYQRGIYPPETFKRVAKYGLGMMVTGDDGLRAYLDQILTQLEAWLATGDVQRLCVVVTGVDSGKTLERWVFAVRTETDKENRSSSRKPAERASKSTKEVTAEIQAIVRQITASVTFLPLLDEACAFDLLVYTRTSSDVPGTWEDTDPCYITNANEVKLRSFTTRIHAVDAAVSYADDADDDDVPPGTTAHSLLTGNNNNNKTLAAGAATRE